MVFAKTLCPSGHQQLRAAAESQSKLQFALAHQCGITAAAHAQQLASRILLQQAAGHPVVNIAWEAAASMLKSVRVLRHAHAQLKVACPTTRQLPNAQLQVSSPNTCKSTVQSTPRSTLSPDQLVVRYVHVLKRNEAAALAGRTHHQLVSSAWRSCPANTSSNANGSLALHSACCFALATKLALPSSRRLQKRNSIRTKIGTICPNTITLSMMQSVSQLEFAKNSV